MTAPIVRATTAARFARFVAIHTNEHTTNVMRLLRGTPGGVHDNHGSHRLSSSRIAVDVAAHQEVNVGSPNPIEAGPAGRDR